MIVDHTSITGLSEPRRGKVRDLYHLGDAVLLIATDRLSAFDVVMQEPIPDKGRILTQLSIFWFTRLQAAAPHHLISAEWGAIASALEAKGVPNAEKLRPMLDGRSMLVKRAEPFPIECVVRGYLAGSLWKDYLAAGGATQAVELYGACLPAGLQQSDRLPEPVFTPAAKAASGHDVNIGLAEAREMVGTDVNTLAARSLALYLEAAAYAETHGLLLADTKFEFGRYDGKILLIDELLTPDSSRYWDADEYEPGRSQAGFDKQFVRDYLDSVSWNKLPPPPPLSNEVIGKTAEKYRQAYVRLTGKDLTS